MKALKEQRKAANRMHHKQYKSDLVRVKVDDFREARC